MSVLGSPPHLSMERAPFVSSEWLVQSADVVTLNNFGVYACACACVPAPVCGWVGRLKRYRGLRGVYSGPNLET